MPRILIASVACFAIIALTACSTSSSGAGGAVETIKPLVGDWDVRSVMGKQVSALLPASRRQPSLSFKDDGSISGFAGVNQVVSTLDTTALSTGAFKISTPAMTRMAGPQDSMAVESLFTQALSTADRYSLKENSLTLKSADQTVMTLARKR